MVKRKTSGVNRMKYTYTIEIFKNKNFLVEEKDQSTLKKWTWTDIEVDETINGKHYFVHDGESIASLNRIIKWLKMHYPELLL